MRGWLPEAGQTAGVAGRLENEAIAERLEAFAALLDLAGANHYTSRAYRRAAGTIRETLVPVDDLVRAGRVRELRGIGPGISARLEELVETGRIAELDELEREVRPELVGLGRLLGLGPRRMLEVAEAVGARTADEFRDAALAGRLLEAKGIGPATERKLVERLLRGPEAPSRGLLLPQARDLLGQVAAALGGEIAGDPRRWVDAPKELAVVVPTAEPERALDAFGRLPLIVAVVERSAARAVGVTVEGVPVELVTAAPGSFGTALLQATGTRAYVAGLGPLPAAPDERSLYEAIGVPWCPPELREVPFTGEPPRLLEVGDIRGDLHCHTTWSDGRASVLEMALAACDLGHEYLAICDHTPSVRVVPGLDAEALRRQGDEIAAANEELAPFRILRGAEVDIRRDGSLDLPDDVLGELDWVQLSLHAGQREEGASLTRKVTEAMRHPAVRCLSHPTGRLLRYRAPNALDVERVVEVALETGVALEVNGLPDRLDLRDEHVRLAVDAGVPIVTSTDAHSTAGLRNLELAVGTARRGWATPADVLNTRPVSGLRRGA
jgi:DNA polymerase (family 10)